MVAHALERLVRIALRTSRCAQAISDTLHEFNDGGNHEAEEAEAMRALMQTAVLRTVRDDGASLLQVAGLFRSIMGM